MFTDVRLRLVLAVVTIALALMVAQTCAAANLLANGGFEEGYDLRIGEYGAVGWDIYGVPGSTHGWTPYMMGSCSYSVEETHYMRNGEPYDFYAGENAMSHSSDGRDATGESLSTQIVDVTPGQWYSASVYVKGWDHTGDGTGWGSADTDSVGMFIRELDAAGVVIGTRTEKKITDAVDWTLLTDTFQAGPNTFRVEYVLHSLMACKYTYGRTAFDDASLDAVPEPSSLLALGSMFGIVGMARRRRR